MFLGFVLSFLNNFTSVELLKDTKLINKKKKSNFLQEVFFSPMY